MLHHHHKKVHVHKALDKIEVRVSRSARPLPRQSVGLWVGERAPHDTQEVVTCAPPSHTARHFDRVVSSTRCGGERRHRGTTERVTMIAMRQYGRE